MENVETVEKTVELQKIVQKLEKLEKMINPNSKKSLILWEEDDGFKKLISTIKEYAMTCDVSEFPIELLDKLKANPKLIEEATNKLKMFKKKETSWNDDFSKLGNFIRR